MTDSHASRPMNPDELEANGFPRNFHELAGAERMDALAKHDQWLEDRRVAAENAASEAIRAGGPEAMVAAGIQAPPPLQLQVGQQFTLTGEMDGYEVKILDLLGGSGNALVELTLPTVPRSTHVVPISNSTLLAGLYAQLGALPYPTTPFNSIDDLARAARPRD